MSDIPDLYFCAPWKNKACKKTACFLNGGECLLTRHIEYAMRGEDGEPIPLPAAVLEKDEGEAE